VFDLKLKRIIFSLLALVTLYVLVWAWILSDVKGTLAQVVSTKVEYSQVFTDSITEEAFDSLNVYKRKMREVSDKQEDDFEYSVDSTFVFHYFLSGRIWVTHSYYNKTSDFGFSREPVTLDIKFNNGEWKIVKATVTRP